MNRTTEELLFAVQRLTGLCLSVYDREFHARFSCGYLPPEHFCSVLHRSADALSCCIESDVAARRACLESGELYAYRCPFGLFEAIVPIYVCGELNGFLMAGKSLPRDGAARTLALAEPYLEDAEHRSLLAQALGSLSEHSEPEYEDICRVLRLLGEHIAAEGGLPYESQSVAAAVRRTLLRNYGMPITLSELAMSFHCSTVSLSKWYYREYEKTIMDDLNDIRMEQAKRMLRDSDASVASIASACGFSDSGYFSKRFRKSTGKSPTEWRDGEESSSSSL